MSEYCIKARGILRFIVDDREVKLQSDGDVSVIVSTQARTATYDGEFTVEERNPQITASFVVPPDVRVSAIQNLCNIPIVLELMDGRTFSSNDASNVSQDAFNPKTGLQTVDFVMGTMVERLPRPGTRMTWSGMTGAGGGAGGGLPPTIGV